MELKKIRSKLCYYDERNPDYDEENADYTPPCYCDNCFYGRDELANEILKLKEEQNANK